MPTSTLVDLVKVISNTVGAGPLALGVAVPNHRGVEALVDGATYSYSIDFSGMGDVFRESYEEGRGVYTASSNTLTRNVITSSEGNAPVGLVAGARIAFVLMSADLNERIGIPAQFTVGPVTTGVPDVEISGISPNFQLDFTLPPGNTGDPGPPGPGNTISIGTVTTLPFTEQATASITGDTPNQFLNLGITVGEPGLTGAPGQSTSLSTGTVTKIPAGGQPTFSVTGTAPTQTLNLGLVTGNDGKPGTPGYFSYVTYSALAATTAAAGATAFVYGADAGTHTDPVVGGVVANVGIYSYSTSPAGWQWISVISPNLTGRLLVDAPIILIKGVPHEIVWFSDGRQASLAINLNTSRLAFTDGDSVWPFVDYYKRSGATDWEAEEGLEPWVSSRQGVALGVHHESRMLNSPFAIAGYAEAQFTVRTGLAFTAADVNHVINYGQSNGAGTTLYQILSSVAARANGTTLMFAEGTAPDIAVANAGVNSPASPTQFNTGFLPLIETNKIGDALSFSRRGESTVTQAINGYLDLCDLDGIGSVGRWLGSTAAFGSQSILVLQAGRVEHRWERVTNHSISGQIQAQAGASPLPAPCSYQTAWIEYDGNEADQDNIITGAQTRAIYSGVATGTTGLTLLRSTIRNPANLLANAKTSAGAALSTAQAPFIGIWQTCYRGILPAGTTERVGLAQIDFVDAFPEDTFMYGPDYPYDYDNGITAGLYPDEFHQGATGKALKGRISAMVRHRVLRLNQRWKPMRIQSAAVQGSTLLVKFFTPFGNTRIMPIRGALFPNYGLKITDDTGDLPVDMSRAPWLVARDIMGIPLTRPVNAALGSVITGRAGLDYPRETSQWRSKNLNPATGNVEMGGTNFCDQNPYSRLRIGGQIRENPNWAICSTFPVTIRQDGI